MKILLPRTEPQGLAVSGEQKEEVAGHPGVSKAPPAYRGLCWSRPPCKAFIFNLVTPTRFGLSQFAGAQVMKEPASGKQSRLDDEQEHARLARAEDPRRVTWQQPNCMLFEAHSQAVADRCRFVLLLQSSRKSEEPFYFYLRINLIPVPSLRFVLQSLRDF